MVSKIYDPAQDRKLPLYLPPHARGRCYYPQHARLASTGFGTATDRMYAFPINIPRGQVYDFMFVKDQSAGPSVHLGIYTDIDGYPGSLLYDSGAIAAPSGGANFPYSAFPNIYLRAGWYWLAVCTNGGSNLYSVSSGNWFEAIGGASATDTALNGGIRVNQTYGTLPSTFPGSPTLITSAILIGLRAGGDVPQNWALGNQDSRLEDSSGGGSSPFIAPHYTGRFYQSQMTVAAVTTLAMSANTLYAMPFIVPKGRSYATINLEVTTLSAGNLRLGIYNDNGGVPGSRVVGSSAISTGTTGAKTATINQALTPGCYWLAVVTDATPTVRAHAAGSSGAFYWLGATSGTDVAQYTGWTVAFTYAALPDPFQAGGALSSASLPRIMLGA